MRLRSWRKNCAESRNSLQAFKHASNHSVMPKDTATAMRSRGGKSRWKGKTAKERTEEMRRVAKLGWAKRRVK
jgi:hypothetical protein